MAVVLQFLLAAATSHIMGSDNPVANSILNKSGASVSFVSSATLVAIVSSLTMIALQKKCLNLWTG